MLAVEGCVRRGGSKKLMKPSNEEVKDAVAGLTNAVKLFRDVATEADVGDPFSFSATILRAHEDDTDHIVARGKLDSGCDENWVAMEVVQRGNLQDDMEEIEDGETYFAFGGQEFSPTGRIDITWYAVNAGKSRKTTFLVHENPPFDLVPGRVFIAKESIFVFDKAALALRHGKFSPEEHRIIEEDARKQNATSDQLGQIRRAEEASARERRRQQKASSRMSMTPASQSTISLLSGTGAYTNLSTIPQRLSSLSQTLSAGSAAQSAGTQSPSTPAQQPGVPPDPGASGTSAGLSGTTNNT
ncbi:hypothetical protein LTR84_002144 [Exophiala bonariae]|uniref:Uncharacterized protein n=1 Tax=Exophiala bonariae TaxID=1690606 RepID=A0AAV9NE28_9EURO|nr:hypothetical protein LTR84_002144 [Exophiala bonariae]